MSNKEKFLEDQRCILSELRTIASCVNTEDVTQSSAFQHRLNIANIDTRKLQGDLDSMLIFDYTLHRELSCLLDALFHPYTASLLHDRVRTYIKRPIRSDSSANVLISGLDYFTPSIFVIKTPTISMLECLYEYVIGKLIINPLRREVPNFVYTYSYNECGTYELEDDKVICWCATDAPQQGYLYLENIVGKQMDVFFFARQREITVVVEVMLQIINALYVADERYSFRHNDLHGENVMIREVASSVCIPITVLGKRQYLYTRYIAQIVDFGAATAVYEGIQLQSPVFYNTLTINNDTFPYDIYMRGMWNEDDKNYYPTVNEWLDQLMNHTPETNHNFRFIASSLIEFMGYNPLQDQLRDQPVLPLRVIDNTQRFYQRYLKPSNEEREYTYGRYYHLIDMLTAYDLCNQPQIKLSRTPVSIPIIVDEAVCKVTQVVKDFPSVDDQEVVGGYVAGVVLQISRLYEIVEVLYILKYHQRIVLPLIRGRELSCAQDAALLENAIKKISSVYQKKIKDIRANLVVTQQKYYYGGYSLYEYNNLIAKVVHALFLLPCIGDI